jgi:hypothetical protein
MKQTNILFLILIFNYHLMAMVDIDPNYSITEKSSQPIDLQDDDLSFLNRGQTQNFQSKDIVKDHKRNNKDIPWFKITSIIASILILFILKLFSKKKAPKHVDQKKEDESQMDIKLIAPNPIAPHPFSTMQSLGGSDLNSGPIQEFKPDSFRSKVSVIPNELTKKPSQVSRKEEVSDSMVPNQKIGQGKSLKLPSDPLVPPYGSSLSLPHREIDQSPGRPDSIIFQQPINKPNGIHNDISKKPLIYQSSVGNNSIPVEITNSSLPLNGLESREDSKRKKLEDNQFATKFAEDSTLVKKFEQQPSPFVTGPYSNVNRLNQTVTSPNQKPKAPSQINETNFQQNLNKPSTNQLKSSNEIILNKKQEEEENTKIFKNFQDKIKKIKEIFKKNKTFNKKTIRLKLKDHFIYSYEIDSNTLKNSNNTISLFSFKKEHLLIYQEFNLIDIPTIEKQNKLLDFFNKINESYQGCINQIDIKNQNNYYKILSNTQYYIIIDKDFINFKDKATDSLISMNSESLDLIDLSNNIKKYDFSDEYSNAIVTEYKNHCREIINRYFFEQMKKNWEKITKIINKKKFIIKTKEYYIDYDENEDRLFIKRNENISQKNSMIRSTGSNQNINIFYENNDIIGQTRQSSLNEFKKIINDILKKKRLLISYQNMFSEWEEKETKIKNLFPYMDTKITEDNYVVTSTTLTYEGFKVTNINEYDLNQKESVIVEQSKNLPDIYEQYIQYLVKNYNLMNNNYNLLTKFVIENKDKSFKINNNHIDIDSTDNNIYKITIIIKNNNLSFVNILDLNKNSIKHYHFKNNKKEIPDFEIKNLKYFSNENFSYWNSLFQYHFIPIINHNFSEIYEENTPKEPIQQIREQKIKREIILFEQEKLKNEKEINEIIEKIKKQAKVLMLLEPLTNINIDKIFFDGRKKITNPQDKTFKIQFDSNGDNNQIFLTISYDQYNINIEYINKNNSKNNITINSKNSKNNITINSKNYNPNITLKNIRFLEDIFKKFYIEYEKNYTNFNTINQWIENNQEIIDTIIANITKSYEKRPIINIKTLKKDDQSLIVLLVDNLTKGECGLAALNIDPEKLSKKIVEVLPQLFEKYKNHIEYEQFTDSEKNIDNFIWEIWSELFIDRNQDGVFRILKERPYHMRVLNKIANIDTPKNIYEGKKDLCHKLNWDPLTAEQVQNMILNEEIITNLIQEKFTYNPKEYNTMAEIEISILKRISEIIHNKKIILFHAQKKKEIIELNTMAVNDEETIKIYNQKNNFSDFMKNMTQNYNFIYNTQGLGEQGGHYVHVIPVAMIEEDIEKNDTYFDSWLKMQTKETNPLCFNDYNNL